ncbi:hypothetical protein, no similarity [Maudiozyma saulgeensis]|uniref:PA14 domain-containing protein n=1 Tax=Maudiozyma saulgeensis TaxID=1789683 RepID=A0A1X7R6Y3_9SACH|nr:hypothetical protein, no similarity [Kazachstania saulgeensis]
MKVFYPLFIILLFSLELTHAQLASCKKFYVISSNPGMFYRIYSLKLNGTPLGLAPTNLSHWVSTLGYEGLPIYTGNTPDVTINNNQAVPENEVAYGDVYGNNITYTNFTIIGSAWFIPPETGVYKFSIAADSAAELMIVNNTNAYCCVNATNKDISEQFIITSIPSMPETQNPEGEVYLYAGFRYQMYLSYINQNSSAYLYPSYIAPDGTYSGINGNIYQINNQNSSELVTCNYDVGVYTTTLPWTGTARTTAYQEFYMVEASNYVTVQDWIIIGEPPVSTTTSVSSLVFNPESSVGSSLSVVNSTSRINSLSSSDVPTFSPTSNNVTYISEEPSTFAASFITSTGNISELTSTVSVQIVEPVSSAFINITSISKDNFETHNVVPSSSNENDFISSGISANVRGYSSTQQEITSIPVAPVSKTSMSNDLGYSSENDFYSNSTRKLTSSVIGSMNIGSSSTEVLAPSLTDNELSYSSTKTLGPISTSSTMISSVSDNDIPVSTIQVVVTQSTTATTFTCPESQATYISIITTAIIETIGYPYPGFISVAGIFENTDAVQEKTFVTTITSIVYPKSTVFQSPSQNSIISITSQQPIIPRISTTAALSQKEQGESSTDTKPTEASSFFTFLPGHNGGLKLQLELDDLFISFLLSIIVFIL